MKTDGNITILNIFKSDAGIYLCRATNLLRTDTKHTQVIVLTKLQFTKVAGNSRAVPLGVTVSLQCSAVGAILVDWKRKGGGLPSGHTKYSNGSLVLRSVKKQVAGTYVCTARNRFRSIEAATSLIVSEAISCSHIKAADGSSRSQNYVIDPDGAGGQTPFTVYCDMSDKNGVGVTVVSHDSEARTHVKKKGCNTPGCYSKDVTYTGASVAQLARLTAVSSNCEQMIKFECKDDIGFIEDRHAWWVSRDGRKMFYWGGATPGSGKCACGMTNTCKPHGQGCNCENRGGAGGSGWREDSGLLTSRSSLPVTQIRLSDVDQPHEEGYHTLGKFKCYGRI